MHIILNFPFFQNENRLFTVKNDSVYVISNHFITNLKTNKSYEIEFNSTNLISLGDKLISKVDGSVYEIKNNLEIERIDLSELKFNQVNPSIFKRNDTIFKFGGYGYWTNKNYFTYFDSDTKEWEIYPNKSNEFPPGVTDQLFALYEDNFIFFGGYSLNENTYQLTENFESWKFDFSELKWKKTPKINFNQKIKNSLIFGDFLILVGGNSNYLIDFNKQKYFEFDNTKLSKILNKNSSNILEFEGDIYFAINTSNGVKNEKINISQILNNGREFDLYKTDYFEYYYLLFFLPILLLIFKSKKNSFLNDLDKNILKLFLTQEYVHNDKLIEIFNREKDLLNKHSITRIKIDYINNLNIKIKSHFSLNDDLILSKRWNKDKRIKIYYINPETNILNKILKN